MSGHLAGFLERTRKFIRFHAFLFAYVCMRHAPTRSWASRALRNDVRTLVQLYEEDTSPLLAVKYVTVETALVNCIVPDPLQPTMHPHDSALDKTFVLFWGAYHVVSTPYPVQGSQVIITPEKL